jgi:chromosome segregation ATPase
LDSTHATSSGQERALDAARRRAQLMEQEAKDSRRLLADQKRSSEAQLAALTARNTELSGKLARMESIVIGEAQALQLEAEEAKRSLAQMESQLSKATGEGRRFEEAHKAALAEAARLAAELEEARGELQLARLHQRSTDNLDALQTQLQAIKNQNAQLSEEAVLLQSKLEDTQARADKVEAALKWELEHHRAEQANTAGASAALHQEISTLKEELEKAQASFVESKQPHEEGTHEDELKIQLAEAEEKISALQADLAREIKRADVAKKVYEAKLAELNK